MTRSNPVPTTVRSFGFNVPCRRFLIRANVSRDRRLPVVDEFVLRALKLCEEVPVRRLAAYFGFSAAEAEKVMSDLTGAGLVAVEGDNVRLHPSAQEYFRGSQDGSPRVVEIESRTERLWFDLISKNMVAPDRTRSAKNLIDIRPSGLARDLPATYARKAFEENFPEYLRKVRRIANPDRFTLYSVSESIAERFGSLVFRMDESLVFDPMPRLQPHLVAIEDTDVPRFRMLVNEMLDAYRGLNWTGTSATALSEFSGLSGETSVTDAYGGSAHLDLARWISLNPEQKSPGRQNIVGASYIRRNVEFLTKLIDSLPKADGIEATREREIVWYRPGGSAWGRSPELQEALASIKLAMRRRFGKILIRTRLISPSSARRDRPEDFRNLFDEGHLAPAGFLSPAIEVVHVPGVAAVLLVTVALSESVQIPIGFATVAAEPLSRIERNLIQVNARVDELWQHERREEEEPLSIDPEIEDLENS